MKKEYVEAYLVGLICGDGHIRPDAHCVIIYSASKGFLDIIREAIIPFYGIAGSLFYDAAAREWKLALSSKEFKQLFVSHYGIPAGNKTTTMTIPYITATQKTPFLEGLYDAEGWYELNKGKYYRIKIKMKNKELIQFVFDILQEKGIYALLYDKGDDVYSVEINKQDQVKKFLNTFTLYHPKWLWCDSK